MSLLPYPKIPACYCYRCPLDTEYPQCQVACARKLREVIQTTGKDYSVAFINDTYPRSTTSGGQLQTEADWKVEKTLVKKGASIG